MDRSAARRRNTGIFRAACSETRVPIWQRLAARSR
jgi:hypothetical protein